MSGGRPTLGAANGTEGARLGLVPPVSSSPNIAVIDDDPRLRTRLAMMLGDRARAGSHSSLAAMASKVGTGPLVVLFGPSFSSASGLADVAAFLRDRPAISAILVVEELSTQVLQQAIRAGVADVITIPEDSAQLVDAVDRASVQLDIHTVDVDPGPGAAEVGKLITVFSTKGGAGKSFVATNLGVLLARKSDKPVCLIDADLQFGDAAVMLKLVPQHTIADAVAHVDRLDVPLIRSLLVTHQSSGLLVLPAPTEPAFADQIKVDEVMRIVDVIRSFCSHVIIDTPSYFTEVVIRLLEESDDIVLVAGMDVPNIKNVKLGLNTLRLLNVPESRVKLVLNRANSKVKIDVGEVERALGIKADTLVPSDISVPQSINKGVPVAIDAPRSGVARSMEAVAALFDTDAVAASRSRR